MAYQAEYIWIDGVEPTPTLRSKTKIIENGTKVHLVFQNFRVNQRRKVLTIAVSEPAE